MRVFFLVKLSSFHIFLYFLSWYQSYESLIDIFFSVVVSSFLLSFQNLQDIFFSSLSSFPFSKFGDRLLPPFISTKVWNPSINPKIIFLPSATHLTKNKHYAYHYLICPKFHLFENRTPQPENPHLNKKWAPTHLYSMLRTLKHLLRLIKYLDRRVTKYHSWSSMTIISSHGSSKFSQHLKLMT